MIPFSGDYTHEEWRRGIGVVMRPRGRGLILPVASIVVLLLAVVLVVVAALQAQELNVPRLVRHSLTAALLGYWVVSLLLRPRLTAERQWKKNGGNLGLRGVVTNDGITSDASPNGDRWETFLKAYSSDDMVVLIGSDGLATLLPRRFFKDDRGWRDFVALVRYKVVEPVRSELGGA